MESSCTIRVATTRKPSFFKTSTTAGPETSTRSPRAQESLTVTTAAVKTAGPSVVEEDIFFLFRPAAARTRAGHSAAGSAAVAGAGADSALGALLHSLRATIALRFIEQPQALHQQTLSVELGSLLIGLALEVEFEVPASPTQNFKDSLISRQRSVG